MTRKQLIAELEDISRGNAHSVSCRKRRQGDGNMGCSCWQSDVTWLIRKLERLPTAGEYREI